MVIKFDFLMNFEASELRRYFNKKKAVSISEVGFDKYFKK